MRSLLSLSSIVRRVLAVVAAPVAVASFAFVAAGCGTSSSSAAPGTITNGGDSGAPGTGDGVTGDLPCDVDAVLATNCRKCHAASPIFGAPMPLLTAGDLHAPAKTNPSRRVFELVPGRIADNDTPMPPSPNPRLSAADSATLTSWVANGAPAGTVKCTTTPPVVPDPPHTVCKPDLPIGPASDYVMQDANDQYVCYGVELTRPTPTHVVGFSPRIDNTSIVHHVVLFEANQAFSTTPAPCSSGGSLQWRMISAWAPGGKGFELPPEAGFPLSTSATTHYVVQVHYSNPLALVMPKDHSGFDLCTSAPRQYEADVMAFGTQNITINAGQKLTANCTYPLTKGGLHFIASMPHMHKLGTDMSTVLLAGGPTGAATDLGTITGWSFNTQAWLDIKGNGTTTGAVNQVNDVVRTKCSWTNTTGATVKFGEKTTDEMCYSFTAYYPRTSLLSWAQPALTSQCTFE